MKTEGQVLLSIYCSLVEDASQMLFGAQQLESDKLLVTKTIKNRGWRELFLLTLPDVCKDLESYLESGVYVKTAQGPLTSLDDNGFPVLFNDIYVLISSYRVEAKAEPIRVLRQLLKVFKKYREECPRQNVERAIDAFLEIERGLPAASCSWGDPSFRIRGCYPSLNDLGNRLVSDTGSEPGELDEVHRALSFIQSVSDDFSRSLRTTWSAFKPKHGPGAVSERYEGSKYEFPSWPERLENRFPFCDYGWVNYSYHMMDEDFDRNSDPPSKLISVPKSYKAPRLIASEPIAAQYIQQGIMAWLRKGLTQSWLRRCIDFRDQTPSKEAALQASRDRNYATIDLSSASDRLSCAVVECIFRKNFNLLEMLNAARTPTILVRDEVLVQKKFAAQGAAFTFPVQTFVYTLVCIGCLKSCFPNESVSKLARYVRVYGDDMIVPAYVFGLVCKVLEVLGLQVNRDKSFVNGYFRESCGQDAYAGQCVTAASILTLRTRDPRSITSVVEASNSLYLKGFINASATLLEVLGNDLKFIPFVRPGSTVIGIVGPNKRAYKQRYNPVLHREESLVLDISVKERKTTIDGRYALMQWFVENPAPDSIHWAPGELRSVKARNRLRWVPSYMLGGQT